jgi:ELWxxDGT repeat protein
MPMRSGFPGFATCCLCALASLPAQTLLRDLEAGVGGSSPSGFTPLRDLVLFAAGTQSSGAEVWRTDGTAAGTQPIDLLPGSGSGRLRTELHALDDAVLFVGSDGARAGLFATDGTLAGTRFVHDLRVGGQPAQWSHRVAVREGIGYLTLWDGAGQGVLLRTDGTPAGTSALRALSGTSGPEIVAAGGRVFFAVLGASHELWSTDGTPAGTVRLASWTASWPEALTAVGARVFFREPGAGLLSPLWVSDGTIGGTRAVSALPPVYVLSIAARAGEAIVLTSPIGGALDLWRSDGTTATHVAQLAPGSGSTIPAFGAGYALAADDAVYVQLGGWRPSALLWRTDGTAAGTAQFWPPGFRTQIYAGLTALGNRVLFGAVYGPGGEEPWVTTGTTAGTQQIADLASGDASSAPRWFALAANLVAGPAILFAADDGRSGAEPWILPAGAIGVAALREIRPGCAAAGARPRLEADGGSPRIGNAAFGLRMRSAHAHAPVALLLDVGIGASWNGCATLLPALLALSSSADASGAARFALPVPNDAALVGARVLAQPLVGVAGGYLLGLADLGAVAALAIGT